MLRSVKSLYVLVIRTQRYNLFIAVTSSVSLIGFGTFEKFVCLSYLKVKIMFLYGNHIFSSTLHLFGIF